MVDTSSFQYFTGTGSQAEFQIAIPYLAQSDIVVKVDGVTQTLSTDYSFSASNVIRFTTAPSNGASILIRRQTDTTIPPRTAFGSTPSTSDLNNLLTRAFYLATEAQEQTFANTILESSTTTYDAGNHKIINLLDGTGAQDAVTKSQMEAADSAKQDVNSNLTALAGLVGAADKLSYFTGAATLALTDLTTYGRSLIATASASAARTVLGLGALATKTLVALGDLDTTGTPSTSTFLRGDFSWQAVSGGGGSGTVTSITAGNGLSGGTITSSGTIALDVNGLTAETTADDADSIVIYDSSASALRKQTRANFLSGISSGSVGALKRQTVLKGAVDSNGLPNFLAAGTGLAVDVSCATTPLVMSFGAGFDSNGAPVDYTKAISSDFSVSSLTANSTCYLYTDYNTGTGAVTHGHTTLAPLYGQKFDIGVNSAINLNEAASSTIVDLYGHTWTKGGNANQDGSGNIDMDGTTDYIETTSAVPSSGAWTIEILNWVLDTAGTDDCIISAGGANRFELIAVTSGTKFGFNIGNGSTWSHNLATLSTNTFTTGVQYDLTITFDGVSAWKLYVNGVLEISITVATIPTWTAVRLGARHDGSYSMDGRIGGYRLTDGSVRYSGAHTPVSGDFAVENRSFYNIDHSSATLVGIPGTTTETVRLFWGEADTGASSVSAVRAYAINGSCLVSSNLTTGSNTSLATNMGVEPEFQSINPLIRYNSLYSWARSSRMEVGGNYYGPNYIVNRNTIIVATTPGTTYIGSDQPNGSSAFPGGNNSTGQTKINVSRSF